MLTEQLGTRIAEALLRLRSYAYAHDRRLSDVAGDIVARRLKLSTELVLAAVTHEAVAACPVGAAAVLGSHNGSCCSC
jgi:hypothetical protein